MTKLDKEIFKEWGKAFASASVMFLLFCLLCVMCGCKTTQYVPVETVRTEYRDRVNTEYVVDSVVDNHYVYIKGDTVIDWRDRVKWRDREVHDSIYINKTDTIRVPYPVERKLSRWEQTKMDLGGFAFWALGISLAAVGILAWIARKRRK